MTRYSAVLWNFLSVQLSLLWRFFPYNLVTLGSLNSQLLLLHFGSPPWLHPVTAWKLCAPEAGVMVAHSQLSKIPNLYYLFSTVLKTIILYTLSSFLVVSSVWGGGVDLVLAHSILARITNLRKLNFLELLVTSHASPSSHSV
jgi:hypothetical protein